MKVLFVTTIADTMDFFPAHVRMLLDAGAQVDIATCTDGFELLPCYEAWGCRVHPMSFSRSLGSRGNLAALRELRALVERERYDVVHTHTPIASACARLACRAARKRGTRVFYTAHGFHFYAGAPKKNWLVFYPVETVCARFTDVLITINSEDYAFAKRRMRAGDVRYVPGVGVDLSAFSEAAGRRGEKRAELGLAEDDRMLLAVGELNDNKNHAVLLRALAALGDGRAKLFLCGSGPNEAALRALAESLGVGAQLRLLGFRRDIPDICAAADMFLFPSRREGLPVSVMEAMASGLPVLASDIRGARDEVVDGEGGYRLAPDDAAGFAARIGELLREPERARAMGAFNRDYVRRFSTENVLAAMRDIYGLGAGRPADDERRETLGSATNP